VSPATPVHWEFVVQGSIQMPGERFSKGKGVLKHFVYGASVQSLLPLHHLALTPWTGPKSFRLNDGLKHWVHGVSAEQSLALAQVSAAFTSTPRKYPVIS
jgi:hypothetical protein